MSVKVIYNVFYQLDLIKRGISSTTSELQLNLFLFYTQLLVISDYSEKVVIKSFEK